jgi:hypothetical protein
MQNHFKKQIDSLMLVIGAFVGIVTPYVVLLRANPFEFSSVSLLEFVSFHPWHGISASAFSITGFSLVAVALKGFRGQFASATEKLEALIVTLSVTFAICLAAYVAIVALSKVCSFVEYRDVRIFATVIGALLGFQIAEQLPTVGENRTPTAFTIAGGMLGYFAAPLFLLFASCAIFIFLASPLTALLSHKVRSPKPIAGRGPASPQDHKKQIHDLQMKIQWVKQSGVASHLIKEETARLTQQIRDLGGSP